MIDFMRIYLRFPILAVSILLAGCDTILPMIIPPPPTSTPQPTPTATLTATPTVIPTATFTPLPSPTLTLFPSATSGEPAATATQSAPPTDPVGIKPVPKAKFRGDFEGGKIVFSSDAEGLRVVGLQITYTCFGDDFVLNLARVSMKIANSSFSYGEEDFYVQGAFSSSTSARGIFNLEAVQGKKTCTYQGTQWNAKVRE